MDIEDINTQPDKETIVNEIEFSPVMIKKMTPYLNDETYAVKRPNKEPIERHIRINHRAYAWYYVHNGGNKADAYRRAYCCKYNRITCKLEIYKDLRPDSVVSGGSSVFRRRPVARCIALIREQVEEKIRADIPQTMLQQLQIQASYDPSMFITPYGSPAFHSWDEIPKEYRCCIEGIESKKDGTKITLVDRAKAREKLLQIAPNMLLPSKTETVHLTRDAQGKEVGLNYHNMSDSDLQAIIARNKKD